ncbi:hypothetical protein HJC23_000460 [Cyclotella cryptica]|uniref:peptidylprolyl isomerase n=1 Tax=Cyclotella cryptica TaxID=29204 RepID=A0ABD3QAQ0_9STRA|eukprot:CCRYP_007204-RA/>CCRYP_007204-RA protein AED:0.43 eAED:0.43 QI:0/-1/0/1/-1/1/1/0/232
MKAFCVVLTTLFATTSNAWQRPSLLPHAPHVPIDNSPLTAAPSLPQRRTFLVLATSSLAALSPITIANAATSTPNLSYITTPTGLQYADVKLGTGPQPTAGSTVSIDYVMSTTGARYGSKIYSTVDAGAPYRWRLGDGSTIPGLEEAVSTMSPGGIRRVIIPAKLAYLANGSGVVASLATIEECQDGKGLGPRPPAAEAVGEFQRFKNIYCNPDRQYQPDLVMDVKLYGKRN